MRPSEACAAACCIALALASAADYTIGRVPVPEPRVLPVMSFPTQLGKWSAGPFIPMSAEAQSAIPTATVCERVYTDPAGHQIDLALVTARQSFDLHDPSNCLPGQGWAILSSGTSKIENTLVYTMDLSQNDQNLTAYYWWTGIYPPKLHRNKLILMAERVRDRYYHEGKNYSLEVRILADPDRVAQSTLTNFEESFMPALNKFVDDGKRT